MAHITAGVRGSPCGAALARLDPVGTDVGTLLPDFADSTYPLLRLVDPYGETYFSTYQMAGLLAELQHLHEGRSDRVLDQLVGLAERCRGFPHQYLVFIGD